MVKSDRALPVSDKFKIVSCCSLSCPIIESGSETFEQTFVAQPENVRNFSM